MTVEEAKRQLSFVQMKGALAAREVIQEAQELAVREHGVEFKTNLWVAESFAVQSQIIKGVRRHARGRFGEVRTVPTGLFKTCERNKLSKKNTL